MWVMSCPSPPLRTSADPPVGPRRGSFLSSLGRSSRAFSLLETIVALGILGIVLTLMMSMLVHHSAIDRRVDAHLGALRALEAHHDALRAGWNPTPGENFWAEGRRSLTPLMSPSEVDATALWAEVTALSPKGFYKVELTIQYRLGAQTFDQELEGLFWKG